MRQRVTALLVLVAGLIAALTVTNLAVANTAGRRLTTTLSGAEQCSSPGVCGVGDPDGSGFATLRLNPGLEQVCYVIVVQDIAQPVEPGPGVGSGHIHEAPAGENGPIAIDLDTQFVQTGPDTFEASGCVSADRSQILDVMLNPENYYVNVHNAEFPGGAVRGQLGD